jgi:hypothetical protein
MTSFGLWFAAMKPIANLIALSKRQSLFDSRRQRLRMP